jgi:hypothetical protein
MLNLRETELARCKVDEGKLLNPREGSILLEIRDLLLTKEQGVINRFYE